MANALDLFPSRVGIGFVSVNGQRLPVYSSAEFLRALGALFERVGGTVAPTIQELDAQQYADAGIEETRALLFAGLDAFASAPPVVQPPADEMAFPPTAWQPAADELPLPPLDMAPLMAGLESMQKAPPIEINQIDQLTAELAGLREAVAVLQTEIDNLKQGTFL